MIVFLVAVNIMTLASLIFHRELDLSSNVCTYIGIVNLITLCSIVKGVW